MGLAEAFFAGAIEGQIERGNDLKERELAGAIEKERADAQKQLIQQLENEGVLLPQYDWESEEFDNQLTEIADDWFKRHPETHKGTGEFQKHHPNVYEAINALDMMGYRGRITPQEYVTIYKALFSF